MIYTNKPVMITTNLAIISPLNDVQNIPLYTLNPARNTEVEQSGRWVALLQAGHTEYGPFVQGPAVHSCIS